jgi:putative transposase
LVEFLDGYSRFVLSWRVSDSLEAGLCVEAFEEALSLRQPEILNSDQGVPFTSSAFTSRLEDRDVATSMDGRGCVLDNVLVVRFWRTVKHEERCLAPNLSIRRVNQV